MPKLLLTLVLAALLITPSSLLAAADYQQQMRDIYQMLNDKHYEQARTALAKVLESKPEDSLALNNLAYAWVGEKNCAKALEVLKRAQKKAKGVKVHNMVTKLVAACPHLGLFTACEPVKDEAQAADLEEIIKQNIATIQDMMKPMPK